MQKNSNAEDLQGARTLELFSQVISKHGRRQLWVAALNLFYYLHTARLQIDRVAHGAVVNACGRGARWNQAWHLLQEAQTMTLKQHIVTYNGATSASGKAWRAALSLQVAAATSQVLPDIITYSTAMSSVGTRLRWQSALSLFRDLYNLAMECDTVSGNAALNALEKGKQWQRAAHSFTALLTTSLRPSIITSNSLMSAFTTLDQWPNSICWLAHTRRLSLQHDAFSHSAVACACEVSEQWQVGLYYMELDASQSLVLCNAAVSTCEKSGRWEFATTLLKHTHRKGMKPDTITHNAVLSSFGQGSRWAEAVLTLSDLSGLDAANTITYNSALSTCAEAHQWKPASRILENLRRRHADLADMLQARLGSAVPVLP